MKQELQEPRLRRQRETENTSLGLTFNLSLHRLSPQQLWRSWAEPAQIPGAGVWLVHPSGHQQTHLGPSVIPEQINCYVGAKEGQGIYGKFHCEEGTVLVSPRQADQTHTSFGVR